MRFTYISKGSADDWTTDTIEAADIGEALDKLDAIYGIERNDNGDQINADMIQVELLP